MTSATLEAVVHDSEDRLEHASGATEMIELELADDDGSVEQDLLDASEDYVSSPEVEADSPKGPISSPLSFSTASEQSLESDNVVSPWEEEARPEFEESATDICPVQHEVCTPAKASGSYSRVDPWLGFKLVGDNLDRRVKPRHQTMDKRGTDFHAFQYIAIKDRVDLSNFSDKHDKPVCLSEEFDANGILPSQDDVMIIKQNFCIIIARIFTEYIPDFQSLSKFVPSHISHKYSSQMRQISEVVRFLKIL